MQFSAYHVYDSIETKKDPQLYDEIELVCHNESEEDEEDSISINYVQKGVVLQQSSNACQNKPLMKK